MTNHVHFIIHIHNDSLSNVMKNINYRYARWFNKQHKRIGHVFQGRYYSISVNDEEYLANLCHYVHFNPVEAKMVDHPDHYHWSSHQYYLSKNPPEWMEITLILTAIKNKTRYSYFQFINTPLDRKKWSPGLFLSEKSEIIIDTDVVRDLHPTLNEKNKIILPQEIVAEIVCKNLRVNYARLLSATRDRKTSHQRTLLIHFWIMYSNIRMKNIAQIFNRTQCTLQRQLNALLNKNTNCFPSASIQAIQIELDDFVKAHN